MLKGDLLSMFGLHPSYRTSMRRMAAFLLLLACIQMLAWLLPTWSDFKGVPYYLPLHELLETASIIVIYKVIAYMLIYRAISVSHDLRSPLRAISGFSQMLLDDYSDKLDEEGKRLLNVVRENTTRMGQLIDDILAFSRSGRTGVSVSEIDMEKLAHAVVNELQPDSGKVQVEIEHIPSTTGYSAMMHQVFINLLSNAIKFSRNKEPASGWPSSNALSHATAGACGRKATPTRAQRFILRCQ
jgi:signal transduction histidine kinase